MSSPLEISDESSAVAGGGFAEVVVIRHGETSWNAAKILQGHMDPELNEIGRRQALTVAERLSKEFKFAAIYSSDLKRAAETAKIISTSCDIATVILDSALRERCLGELQGISIRDAAKQNPKAYKVLVSRNADQEIPGGGESINQLHDRCVSALENIARKHGGERVLVVTHGGVIRELHQRAAYGIAPSHGGIPNTSINIFHISNDGKDWTITRWADVRHLNGAGFMKNSFGGDGKSG